MNLSHRCMCIDRDGRFRNGYCFMGRAISDEEIEYQVRWFTEVFINFFRHSLET